MNSVPNVLSRRSFLKNTLRAAAGSVCARSTLGMLGSLGAASVQSAPNDYRALVCLFLAGGNDGFGTVVPSDEVGHALYSLARPQLALLRDTLLPLAGLSETIGLHPNCGGLRDLFDQNRMAVVSNVGVLMAPTTRSDYRNNRNLPPALFSHNDQQDQWMSGAGRLSRTGWAGRIHDLLGSQNGSSLLSMNVSVGTTNLFQVGTDSSPYILGSDGAQLLAGITNNSARFYPYAAQLDRAIAAGHKIEATYARRVRSSIDTGELVKSAMDDAPAVTTAFPATTLGSQLALIARTIAARNLLGMRRQIFFVNMSGFDTHDNQIPVQANRLAELSDAVAAFYAATQEMGIANDTTLFTMSDFGRTLTSNGDGTDHGWGNHHFVIGGAVQGGRVVGNLPDLTLDGPQDAGFGRIIPTTAMEQYGATLARWFGVAESDLPLVFPNLGRFASSDLGFMA